MRLSLRSLAAVVAVAVLTLSGCAATDDVTGDGRIQVVTTTNVYADVAAQVGGERVDVTAIINSSAKDPHSYEASARDRLAVQKADLVIENGGGYDAFMHDLLDGAKAPVLTVVGFSADFPADDHEAHATDDHDHADHDHIEGFNEHVWFDLPTMSGLVAGIAKVLGEIDPAGSEEFDANAAALLAEFDALDTQLQQLKADVNDADVFLTEPVPGHLVTALGLTDLAPEGFAAAVEEGRDVAPAMLLAALDVIDNKDVRAVLTNEQTGGAETRRVEEAAKAAGIPIVSFGEILPESTTYVEWMRTSLDSLAAALAA